MERIINIHEAKTHFSKLIERVQSGEEIIIGKAGSPVAVLKPYSDARGRRPLGLGKGRILMRENFDDPVPDWEELTG